MTSTISTTTNNESSSSNSSDSNSSGGAADERSNSNGNNTGTGSSSSGGGGGGVGAGGGITTSSTTTSSNTGTSGRIMNSIELEYSKIHDHDGWVRLYHEIREKCDREANEKHFSTSESEKAQNRCLNRYRDVNPYDHSRIILHRGRVDYINANLVKLERADRKYILTQGPLDDTVGHFWLMVWEQKTKAILMLNKLMEKKQIKCHMYWPKRKGADHALKLDEVKLTVELVRCEEYRNFCRRWFKLTDLETNNSREIIQFHYTTWPDFGIPSSPVAFLHFLKQVRDSGALDADVGPAVVHCSAGIGRSGTFCLVDCCLVLIDKEGENSVSVQDVLYELRRYRMGLIQTADQLYFSYQAIIEGMTLLKNQMFLDYKEEPFVCNDDQAYEEFHTDEIPPPLPPRTHSLLLPLAGSNAGGALTLNLRGNNHHHNQVGGKPLPKIPASESFNDDLYDSNNSSGSSSNGGGGNGSGSGGSVSNDDGINNHSNSNKDALNNFINSEKLAETMSNRPLPPLPPLPSSQKKSLDRVHESDNIDLEHDDEDDDSDDEDIIDLDDDDDDDDDDDLDDDVDDDNENDERIDDISMNVMDTIGVDIKDNNANKDQSSVNSYGGQQSLLLSSSSSVNDGRDSNDMKNLNGLDGGPSTTNINTTGNSSNPMSTENELKRRKRIERQTNIEQKVNEIKRKRREAEDSKQAAKKRRSLVTYLAAGVIVGVICVYAYSKLA